MNESRNLAVTLFAACVLSLGVSGCDRAESPSKTAADVSEARAEGAENVAEQRHDAAVDTMDAHKDVNKASAELAHQSAEGQRSITVAQAESSHKVAIEKCEALTGDLRSDCKKQADIDLDQAKMQAATNEQMADPKR